MTDVHALPQPNTASGKPRHVGVEIEFAGITEQTVADVAKGMFGGTIEQREEKGLVLTGSEIGDLEIYLDTAYLSRAENWVDESIHSIARTVVPLEIVTSPILPDRIADLDALLDELVEKGASGTTKGLFAGYGIHFNPEVVSTDLDDIFPILCTYAFCEDALREEMGVDFARRVLPFVDPYPKRLLDALASHDPKSVGELIDLYIDNAPSRNHGLDMLCLFKHIDNDRVTRRMQQRLISARPTFHYRLPDCRIDEPDWSLALEWNRWVRIERLAQDRGLVRELRRAWRAHSDALTTRRADWTRWVKGKLGEFA